MEVMSGGPKPFPICAWQDLTLSPVAARSVRGRLLVHLALMLGFGSDGELVWCGDVHVSGYLERPATDCSEITLIVVHHPQLPRSVGVGAIEGAQGDAAIGSRRRSGKRIDGFVEIDIGGLKRPVAQIRLWQRRSGLIVERQIDVHDGVVARIAHDE